MAEFESISPLTSIYCSRCEYKTTVKKRPHKCPKCGNKQWHL